MKLIGLSGSPTARSKTLLAVQQAVKFAIDAHPELDAKVINIRDHDVQFCDGRDASLYDGDTRMISEAIVAADGLIIGTPMYRGSYTGILKNLFDVLPNDALRGKPVGLIATGGSDHHYLALEHELRPLMGFFSAYTLPGAVYAKNEDYSDTDLVSTEVIERLRDLALAVVEFATRVPPNLVGAQPPSIRRRALGPDTEISRKSHKRSNQRSRGGRMAAKPKSLTREVDGETYRTAVAHLLADDGKSTFLFRALNSNYFVQRQGKADRLEVLSAEKAEALYHDLAHKHQSLVAAFPKGHGGVGMETTSSYDDEDEKERLAHDYGVDVDHAYVGMEGTPQSATG